MSTTSSSTSSIPRLTLSKSTYSHFRTHHLIPNTPCIFPPQLVQTNWKLFQLWFNIDNDGNDIEWEYLDRKYGHLEVNCIDTNDDTRGSEMTTFGSLLQEWKRGEGKSKYLKDWHLPLKIYRSSFNTSEAEEKVGDSGKGKGKLKVEEELYTVLDVCLDDWMNDFEGIRDLEGPGKEDDFRFVYAGGGDTFTPLHRDVYCSYSISTQLHGRKLWYLFPPSCTPLLLPLLSRAHHEDRSINVQEDWSCEVEEEWETRGMKRVWQEKGETIFIPSGWYHSVHNLTHPTFSLNHNWSNSHNLTSIYESLSLEVSKCRNAIEDVREILIEKSRRDGGEGDGWKKEWEEEVDRLVERSEGWSWKTFWKMTLNSLESLGISEQQLDDKFKLSRWPKIPPNCRPPIHFVLEQVRPLVLDFRNRKEEEWRYLEGLDDIIRGVERQVDRLLRLIEQ